MNDLEPKIKLAEKLADISEEIICRYFRQPNLAAATKKGEVSAIVTLADRLAEEAMVDVILQESPGDGIIREEGENIPSQTGQAWVLDPIDGTASFVRGLPIFGTLIGLVELANNLPLLGVVNQPILRERWLGRRGQKARFNNRLLLNPYAEDTSCQLEEACLVSTTPFMFLTNRQKKTAQKLQAACQRQAFGGDCYNYMMLASGWSGMPMVILEADLKYYDFCALIPILEGTGSAIADWSGSPLDSQTTEVIAASNPALLKQALAVIGLGNNSSV